MKSYTYYKRSKKMRVENLDFTKLFDNFAFEDLL